MTRLQILECYAGLIGALLGFLLVAVAICAGWLS